MSFSGGIKDELIRQESGSRAVMLAELAAILAFCGEYSPEEGGWLLLKTEYSGTLERFWYLAGKLFGSDPAAGMLSAAGRNRKQDQKTELKGAALQELSEHLEASEAFLLQTQKDGSLPGTEPGKEWVKRSFLRRENCRRAFLRGAYLAAGSMSDPNRSYHFEISCRDDRTAAQMRELLQSLEVGSRIVHRRKMAVVYVKESEQIARLLGLMEARMALLEYENIRILREVRGNVNRQVNCETANISKTANAAAQQIEDIRYIAAAMGLSKLTNGLDEIAEVRLQYPTATLKELGEHLDPPIGKSGVNHRLRKLSEIARQLRGTRGGVCND